jgi:tellurite resistance protein TerB
MRSVRKFIVRSLPSYNINHSAQPNYPMSFWNNLKEKATALNASLQTSIAQFKNAEFANGCMAICALIAAADGNISAPEKAKIATLILSNESLKVFSASELKDKFDFFCKKLTADFDFGRIEAIQAIAKLKSKPDQARAVIQIGIVIGGADGNFDLAEKAVVKEVCHAVGMAPAEFDL